MSKATHSSCRVTCSQFNICCYRHLAMCKHSVALNLKICSYSKLVFLCPSLLLNSCHLEIVMCNKFGILLEFRCKTKYMPVRYLGIQYIFFFYFQYFNFSETCLISCASRIRTTMDVDDFLARGLDSDSEVEDSGDEETAPPPAKKA